MKQYGQIIEEVKINRKKRRGSTRACWKNRKTKAKTNAASFNQTSTNINSSEKAILN